MREERQQAYAPTRVERQGLRWEIAAKRAGSGNEERSQEARVGALERIEERKASIRAMVEHPFRVIKRQFGLIRGRFRGLANDTARAIAHFALSNLWMARRRLWR